MLDETSLTSLGRKLLSCRLRAREIWRWKNSRVIRAGSMTTTIEAFKIWRTWRTWATAFNLDVVAEECQFARDLSSRLKLHFTDVPAIME